MSIDHIRLKNIKTQQNIILHLIFELVSNPTIKSAQIQQITQTLVKTVTAIEKICFNQQATPANLSRSSRQIYSWMKFLTEEVNLQLHLESTLRVQQIAQQMLAKHGQSVKLMIEFTSFALLYKGKRSGDAANIIVNEGFINASEEVITALVESALFGRNQDNTRLIRSFASSEEYSNVLLELDLIAEVIAENPQGKFYNLNELFDKLNREYFAATLAKPRLAWSQINTYRKFGHYEPARDRVVISLTLDNGSVPEFVSEFVLYHELLHKYHGTNWVQGRRMVHTREFRVSESQFKLYNEASRWLEKLATGQTSKRRRVYNQ
ncbi:M48 family peptidase [Nostoc sp. CHAB 5824]|nr:M48 family peptidase [Nostoc sp. CHAB 5824]